MTDACSRRAMLGGLGSAAVMAAMPVDAARRRLFFERIGRPIGLQLYTLGAEVAKDVDGVLAEVARIGYRDLQLPGLFGRKPEELRAAADRAGVKFTSLHLPMMQMPGGMGGGVTLLSPAQQIADVMGALGARDVAAPLAPFPAGFRPGPGEDFKAAIARTFAEAGGDHWKRTADQLNERGAALKPLGLRLGYHNHNVEFMRFGKKSAWEILASATDPSLVFFEVDLGWVAAGGLDPVAFLRRYSGRVKWLHLKDLLATTKVNTALGMDPTQVGDGKQDWARILPAAARAGAEHYYVEQEAPFAMPRMDAARRSFAYLSALRA